MLKNVLVPLDGSPTAEAALPYAEALARRSGASLTLVCAVHSAGGGPAQVRAIDDAQAYLNEVAADLATRGISASIGVPYGPAATWIVEEVDLRGTDLIVMATHGRTGPDRWLHGSVADAVVRHSGVPVLVVRAANGLRPSPRFDQPSPIVMVPLDGSPFAEAALPVATDLARLLDGRLVLIGAVPSPGQLVAGDGGVTTYVGDDHAQITEDARAYLAGMADQVGTTRPVETVLRVGEPASQIGQAAAEYGAAAVVMATHGRTGLARSLFGSVAGGVVHSGATPVLLVRPADLRPAEVPALTADAAAPA